MLAAVLVIVAIAVFYVTRGVGPMIVVSAKLKAADNTVWLKGETGCDTITDWSVSYKGGTVTDWQSTTDSIGPGDEIQLTALTNAVALGDTVTIKYDATTKSAVINVSDEWTAMG